MKIKVIVMNPPTKKEIEKLIKKVEQSIEEQYSNE